MSTQITLPIARAFAASNVFTFTTPADAASGTSATTWAPVLAELTRLAPASAPRSERLSAHTQVVAELRRIRDQIPTVRKLGPTERLAFGNWLQVLLNSHEAQLAIPLGAAHAQLAVLEALSRLQRQRIVQVQPASVAAPLQHGG